MEKDGSNIIKMSIQCEQTAAGLVRPHLNLVVIAARDEEGLSLVKIDTSNRSVVLLESIDQRSHSIIPELNGGRVKRDEDPWPVQLGISLQFAAERAKGIGELPLRVEGNAFGSG